MWLTRYRLWIVGGTVAGFLFRYIPAVALAPILESQGIAQTSQPYLFLATLSLLISEVAVVSTGCLIALDVFRRYREKGK